MLPSEAVRLLLLLLLTASACTETRHLFADALDGLTPEIAPEIALEPDAAERPVVPESLRGATWRAHLEADILPFWTTDAALGTPPGNYPTYRGMDGTPQNPTERRPRMISRQIYLYVVAFLMTGDAAHLDRARAGVEWLLAHAIDEHGACHARLNADGSPAGDDPKTAQDVAYCGLGLAAWTFLTRDPAAEAAVLKMRDLLFDPTRFWDADNGRIRDALSADLTTEVDVEGDGGWELVAQLDAINALLLLVQPVVSEPARREQLLDDLRTLSNVLVDRFLADGIFWGVHSQTGQFGGKHVDFGHTLKSYWMIGLVDARLSDHPFASLSDAGAEQLLRAWDDAHGRWAKRPTSATEVEYGSDWWVYAEADQLAATLSLTDPTWTERVAMSAGHWIDDYVDRTRPAREVVPGVDREGKWVWDWTDTDTAKCNHWKSGFHTAEHALVMYLVGSVHEGKAPQLYFAPVEGTPADFEAPAYVFSGNESGREAVQHGVLVTYSQLFSPR